MSELPFMQLYVSDYLGDTRHLSCEQHGAYLLLLMTLWNARGTLPNDDTKLARIVCVSLKKWRGMKADVMAFFDAEGGVISHQRVSRELQKSARQSESRASAGAVGGRAKALKNNNPRVASAVANAKHLPEPYRKEERAIALDPTDSPVRIDKHIEGDLFAACLTLHSAGVPKWAEHWSWPRAVVAQAAASLKAGTEH